MHPIDRHFKALQATEERSFHKAFLEWMYAIGEHVTVREIEDFAAIRERFLKNAWSLDIEREQCFRNAFRAAEFYDDFLYVEGWTAIRGKLIEHAWIAYRSPGGLIHFDPTLELALSLQEERSYFAVILLDREGMNRFVRETGTYGGWMEHLGRKLLT